MASVSQRHLAVKLRSAARPRRTGHLRRIGPFWCSLANANGVVTEATAGGENQSERSLCGHAAISKEPLSCDCFSIPPFAQQPVNWLTVTPCPSWTG